MYTKREGVPSSAVDEPYQAVIEAPLATEDSLARVFEEEKPAKIALLDSAIVGPG